MSMLIVSFETLGLDFYSTFLARCECCQFECSGWSC